MFVDIGELCKFLGDEINLIIIKGQFGDVDKLFD